MRAREYAQKARFVLFMDRWAPVRCTIWTAQEREAFNEAIEHRLGKRSLKKGTLRRLAGLGMLYWLLSHFGYV